MSYLILIRHGQSQWNALNVWTGLTNISLTEKGRLEAKQAAQELRGFSLHRFFSSKLARAQETLEIIKTSLGFADVPTHESTALNERNYGIFTGKNRDQVKEQIGEIEFQKIRRGWNHPIENGESLFDVYQRVVPFYENTILQELCNDKNVLVVAHGNSLRAMIKRIEHLSDTAIELLELQTGEMYIYQIDSDSNVISKEIRKIAV